MTNARTSASASRRSPSPPEHPAGRGVRAAARAPRAARPPRRGGSRLRPPSPASAPGSSPRCGCRGRAALQAVVGVEARRGPGRAARSGAPRPAAALDRYGAGRDDGRVGTRSSPESAPTRSPSSVPQARVRTRASTIARATSAATVDTASTPLVPVGRWSTAGRRPARTEGHAGSRTATTRGPARRDLRAGPIVRCGPDTKVADVQGCVNPLDPPPADSHGSPGLGPCTQRLSLDLQPQPQIKST